MGWLPGLSVVIAVGLLLVAVADPGARFGAPWAGPSSGSAWPWPSAPPPRLAAEAPGRSERLLLVLLLGMGLYLVKVLHSPRLHLPRRVPALAHGGRHRHQRAPLRGEPLLPVSALFPGLEIVTGALTSLGAPSLRGRDLPHRGRAGC